MGKSRINFCQNLKPNFAQVPEQSDFTYGVYLVAAEHLQRWPARPSNSQDVSHIQRALMTLVLRLIMNEGFSFDSSIVCSELFQVSWVNRW